ncbi:MAG: NRDE family protein [bacterium]
MCTLTAVAEAGELIITMNRDEHKARDEAKKLQINYDQQSQLKSAFPVDLLSSGTWFGVNNAGVIMALLNRYQDRVESKSIQRSRGSIIPSLLKSGSIDEVNEKLKCFNASGFEAFDLYAFSSEYYLHFSWNGEIEKLSKQRHESFFFTSSSSVSYEQTFALRKEGFIRSMQDEKRHKKNLPEQILKAHLFQDQNNTSQSIFVERETIHTKSICQVVMDEQQTKLDYFTQHNLKQMKAQYHAEAQNEKVVFKLNLH